MNSKQVIVVGAFHEIIELLEDNGFEIIGLIDSKMKDSYRSYRILCSDENVMELSPEQKQTPVLISPDLPEIRKKLVKHYSGHGFEFFTLISKEAKCSISAIVGRGSVVQYGVNISAEVQIGQFVKLNSMCNVMHNAQIGDYTTVAPNAVLLGNVFVGESCYIGSNATILPQVKVCNDVIIGAGAVVNKDITEPGVYVGVPARKIK